MNTGVLFQVQSFLILSLIFLGIYFRYEKDKHVKIMSLAIGWDVILILQIELSREALLKASQALSNPFLLNIHIFLAILCVLFYISMIYTGRKVLAGDLMIRPLHKKLGIVTVCLRTATFITSFFTTTKG